MSRTEEFAAGLARGLDQSREQAEARHQDDLTYVPDWEPLHRSDLDPSEHDGWMFMNRSSSKDDWYSGAPSLTLYKHGISREPLHLDQSGQAWERRNAEWTPVGSASKALSTPKPVPTYGKPDQMMSHYDLLGLFGAKPATKYDPEYIASRSKRLKDAGWNTVLGG